jgi:hypothetical protein
MFDLWAYLLHKIDPAPRRTDTHADESS